MLGTDRNFPHYHVAKGLVPAIPCLLTKKNKLFDAQKFCILDSW